MTDVLLLLCTADPAAVHESLDLLSELTNSAEFEGPRPSAASKPAAAAPADKSKSEPWLRNRLRDQAAFWKSFCTSVFVITLITSGYSLPWANGPPPTPFAQKNHPSAFQFPQFVSEAVASLVVTGAAMEVSKKPFIVSPLGVVPKGLDKLRLILDLRYVNSFLKVDKFKYESIKEVSNLCKLRDFLFTVDLKSGYHHIDINPEFWQFLGFEWQGKYYVFCQLPFGLATACYVFTKLIKQLVQRWRKLGIRLIPYIDDFFFTASSAQEFAYVQAQVLADFAKAGFVLSKEKCQLQMSHVVKFLGFVVDTLHGKFHLSATAKAKLASAISSCLASSPSVPAKALARVTGLVASMSFVTGPVAGLFTRFLHRTLDSRSSWRSSVALDDDARSELQFWQQSLPEFSSRPIWRPSSLVHVLQYDAGGDGWGGHLTLNGVQHEAHGFWAPSEVHGQKSSTWRELEGLFRLLQSVGHLLSGHRVTARGDALNVFWLLTKGGSRAPHLHQICLRIFQLCHSLQIELSPEWVPREQNQLADKLSKLVDVDDFGLQPAVFEHVRAEFGPLHVDRLLASIMHSYQSTSLSFGRRPQQVQMLSPFCGLVLGRAIVFRRRA